MNENIEWEECLGAATCKGHAVIDRWVFHKWGRQNFCAHPLELPYEVCPNEMIHVYKIGRHFCKTYGHRIRCPHFHTIEDALEAIEAYEKEHWEQVRFQLKAEWSWS